MKHARDDYAHIQDPSGKIPEDEPVFLLRAQDMSAPKTLNVWANALRSLAKRLSDWPWQTIRGYCSRTGWILALEQDCQISAAALSAQADLLDELSKQKPVAWMYRYPARAAVGISEVFLSEVKIDRNLGTWLDEPAEEVPLYARPQPPRDWKQLNDDLAEELDELDSLRNKTKPKG